MDFLPGRAGEKSIGLHRDGNHGRRRAAETDGCGSRQMGYVARVHRADVLLRIRGLLRLQLVEVQQRGVAGPRDGDGRTLRDHAEISSHLAACAMWRGHSCLLRPDSSGRGRLRVERQWKYTSAACARMATRFRSPLPPRPLWKWRLKKVPERSLLYREGDSGLRGNTANGRHHLGIAIGKVRHRHVEL